MYYGDSSASNEAEPFVLSSVDELATEQVEIEEQVQGESHMTLDQAGSATDASAIQFVRQTQLPAWGMPNTQSLRPASSRLSSTSFAFQFETLFNQHSLMRKHGSDDDSSYWGVYMNGLGGYQSITKPHENGQAPISIEGQDV